MNLPFKYGAAEETAKLRMIITIKNIASFCFIILFRTYFHIEFTSVLWFIRFLLYSKNQINARPN